MTVSFKYEVVKSAERLGHLANEIAGAEAIGLDLETTSKRPIDGNIRLLQVNTGSGIYVVDAFETGTLGPVPEAIATSKAIKVIQNAKFEQAWFLAKYGLELWPVFDVWRGSVLLHNGKLQLSHDLWSILRRELNREPEAKDLQQSDWSGALTEEQYEYAAEDVAWLLDLRESLRAQLMKRGLGLVALIEFGAALPEAAAELNGVYLDRDAWLELAEKQRGELKQRRNALVWQMPHPDGQQMLPGFEPDLNLDSAQQVLKSLRLLGVDLADTREMTLAMKAGQFPVVQDLIAYRKVSKLLTAFGPDYVQWIHPKTGRVHVDYYPMLLSGRYGCRSPNLQQIPRDPAYRACFRAPPGRKLVTADYAGIEMRIVAEISGDKRLMNVFQSGQDAHYATASILTKKPIEQVTKDERQKAKPANFGFIYGMQAEKFVLYAQTNYKVSLSKREAETFRNNFFEAYSGVARWHEFVRKEVMPTKLSQSIAGRLRYLDGDKVFNEFYNNPVQSTGADGLKLALRLVYEGLKKAFGSDAFIVHHVHDEILTEVPDDPEAEQLAKTVLKDRMTEAMSRFLKKVPVEVDPSSGYTWAETK